MRWATAFVALVIALGALGCFAVAVLAPGGSSAAPVAAGSLACSVKPANPGCDTGAGEVAVFRMAATSNAHAAAAGDLTYTNLVCCGGVTSPGTSCSGTYDTVLRLSKVDYNAHVQATGSYPTEVCLSAGTTVVDCMFAGSCATGYACLATTSASDNAHVADCDGPNAYATKLCCFAGAALPTPVPVGGIAELPEVSGSSGPNYVVLAGLAAAVVAALGAGAWYARRRWGR
jgi:hypothetical protein